MLDFKNLDSKINANYKKEMEGPKDVTFLRAAFLRWKNLHKSRKFSSKSVNQIDLLLLIKDLKQLKLKEINEQKSLKKNKKKNYDEDEDDE